MSAATEPHFDFEAFSEAYKGGVSAAECAALARYAAGSRGQCIVEIGSFKGKSAVALAHGLRQRRDADGKQVYCIEPHLPFVGVLGGTFGPRDRADFYRIMLDTGYFEQVSLVNLPSLQASIGWDKSIGLLFIDGDHNYSAVKQDFIAWEPHVVEGGVIALDDSLRPKLGPTRFIAELLEGDGFEKIEVFGKITFLRKRRARRGRRRIRPLRHVLLACHELVLAGGMLRFERFGREIGRLGHRFAYLQLGERLNVPMETEFEVLDLPTARAQVWDVTMVPGQGFPAETRDKFERLRHENFGYRVQHVLNDRTYSRGFIEVNRSFRPDLVVFNNRHWPPGSFTEFVARKFVTIEGAVDPVRLAPRPGRPAQSTVTVIGGQAKARSVVSLLEAIRLLPEDYVLQLFGRDSLGGMPAQAAGYQDLFESGRVRLLGPLSEDALSDFYHGCDIVVHTETFAGWANLAAEAMACGVPVVCTPSGTLAFATHEETALVIDAPEPEVIAAAARRLAGDPELASRLARNARRKIIQLNWLDYATKLMDACVDDQISYYTHAPELGLYGKWPLRARLAGLDPLLGLCRGLTVLDLGSAEGVVAREFMAHQAALVHGFDSDSTRVRLARTVCADFAAATFRRADISDWSRFTTGNTDLLIDAYDAVLYLGIHHHLPRAVRAEVISGALRKSRRFFALRTPAAVSSEERLAELIRAAGFELLESAQPALESQGALMIFERR